MQKTKPTVIQTHDGRGLNLATLEDMFRFAQYVAISGLAPKDMQKAETILVAIEMGLELGLQPMQAIQNIAVINGRPGLWGDAVPGLVRGSGKQEFYKQEKIGTPGTDGYGYRVTSKRKGDPDSIVTEFTIADAKKASLWGKSGPWTFYPDRMLLNRARAFNARDNFPDVLKGMRTAEEIQDVEFEVMESKPLEDGDKTSRLAEKLASKIVSPVTTPLTTENVLVTISPDTPEAARINAQVSAEVTAEVAESVPENAGFPEQEKPVESEPEKRKPGRPVKQEALPVDYKFKLAEIMHKSETKHWDTDFANARKALDIRKLYISELEQDEAKSVLEWLERK